MKFIFGAKAHSGRTNLIIIRRGYKSTYTKRRFWMARDEKDNRWYRDDFKPGWVRAGKKARGK